MRLPTKQYLFGYPNNFTKKHSQLTERFIANSWSINEKNYIASFFYTSDKNKPKKLKLSNKKVRIDIRINLTFIFNDNSIFMAQLYNIAF